VTVAFDDVTIATSRGDITALVHIPAGATWLYALAHGAGAGMKHPFMTSIASRLAGHSIATLRYEFPYLTAGRKRPDPGPQLEACVRDVVTFAAREYGELRIAAGGKSMGGRITSQAQAASPLPNVERIIFLGFPLHGMGQAPNIARAAHLAQVTVPMLFLQGTRDTLADLSLMRQVCADLGPRVTLHVIDGADHSFAVNKSTGRTNEDVKDELAQVIATWVKSAG
jgi:uncharacterized protein